MVQMINNPKDIEKAFNLLVRDYSPDRDIVFSYQFHISDNLNVHEDLGMLEFNIDTAVMSSTCKRFYKPSKEATGYSKYLQMENCHQEWPGVYEDVLGAIYGMLNLPAEKGMLMYSVVLKGSADA